MTDSRLETLLAQGPPGGDDATGLATRARGRQRARRRTTGLTVAAVALAVAAVPVTAAVVDDDQGLSILRPDPQVLQTEPAVDPRTRTETWHRLSLEVPADWDHHGGADWCVATREPGFGVDRPEGVTAAIGCTPGQAYGVTFGDGSAIRWVYDSGHVWQYRWKSESESESESEDQVKVYPEDSWLGLVQDGDDYALVVTRSEALTRRIVESADVVRRRRRQRVCRARRRGLRPGLRRPLECVPVRRGRPAGPERAADGGADGGVLAGCAVSAPVCRHRRVSCSGRAIRAGGGRERGRSRQRLDRVRGHLLPEERRLPVGHERGAHPGHPLLGPQPRLVRVGRRRRTAARPAPANDRGVCLRSAPGRTLRHTPR